MKKIRFLFAVLIITPLILISCSPGKESDDFPIRTIHILEVNERLLHFEDGFIIGNGDLSVSVYQSADRIIWRFGKNDVWDRRLDRTDSYKPVHIKELAKGIREEGWKSDGFGQNSRPVALHGTNNPQRMREVVGGSPPEYSSRPYPCPKPVGELIMQLPPDLADMKIVQRLIIEEGRMEIHCSWQSGVEIRVNCFIPSSPNLLVVNWQVRNWNENTRQGRDRHPVWFWLKRWADPDYNLFNLNYKADFGSSIQQPVSSKVTPLPQPCIKVFEGITLIEQYFGKDLLFKDGFRYWAVPFAPEMKVSPVDMSPTGEARISIVPDITKNEGWFAVQIATSSDKGGVEHEVTSVKKMFQADPVSSMKNLRVETIRDAKLFWDQSGVSIDDSLLENLWYETLHIRRSTTRAGIDPPGLFLPSTVHDYSRWHGDYHTNYNLQSPFWGDYAANHSEIGDSYFKAMEYFFQIGRKIAHDYYDARGTFIQLLTYPLYAGDDPYGTGFCSRLAYMTGWAMNQYWSRYLYSQDTTWLRETGYPAIKEGALFYTDFLMKGNDGMYHAYPSQDGEESILGNPEDVTDQPQVMRHIRYNLRAAIKASEILGMDKDLRDEWKDRLDHSAPDRYSKNKDSTFNSYSGPPVNETDKQIDALNPPEFGFGKPYKSQYVISGLPSFSKRVEPMRSWYFGQFPWRVMQLLREGSFRADSDFTEFRKTLEMWRRPNGIMQGMAIANYGRSGAWTESLGILAPLQEMMLQSWDGAIRIFPAFPSGLSASFRDLRAEGAFLVSAEKCKEAIKSIRIKSLAGLTLNLYNPFPESEKIRITDDTTGRVLLKGSFKSFEILKIKTEKNHAYSFRKI